MLTRKFNKAFLTGLGASAVFACAFAHAEDISPGDHMPDGTLYAGISPDTNKPMYTTLLDPIRQMSFDVAQKYCTQLESSGHKDWHLPTKSELNVLFNNRAAVGKFDQSGPDPWGWYWSASPGSGTWDVWQQRFSDGLQFKHDKTLRTSLRCVR